MSRNLIYQSKNRLVKPSISQTLRLERNWSHRLSTGLVGHWLMNESVGNILIDTSRNYNEGSLQGGMLWTEKARDGNNGLNFDDINDYVDMGDNLNFERTDPFSISSWYRINSISQENFLVSKETQGGAFRGYGYVLDSDNKFYILLVSSNGIGNLILVSTNSTFTDTTFFHHAVMTYDGSSSASGVNFYHDGIIENLTINTDGLTSTIITSTTFQIGARNGTRFFNGVIDDVRIYDRELTSDEVSELFVTPYSDLVSQTPIGLKSLVVGADIRNFIIPAYMRINA